MNTGVWLTFIRPVTDDDDPSGDVILGEVDVLQAARLNVAAVLADAVTGGTLTAKRAKHAINLTAPIAHAVKIIRYRVSNIGLIGKVMYVLLQTQSRQHLAQT
jgi:hypothetical protein